MDKRSSKSKKSRIFNSQHETNIHSVIKKK